MPYSDEFIKQIENLYLRDNIKKQIQLIEPIIDDLDLDIDLKYKFELLCYYCEALIDINESDKALKLINSMKLKIKEDEITIELILFKYIEIY